MKSSFKKNELKNLIYIQENKSCNEQTINGLFRSIVEPVLDGEAEGLILLRLEDKSKKSFNSILKRLEYSNSKIYDFSSKLISEKFENILSEDIWEKTEFIYVLTARFGAVLIFDYEENEIEGCAEFYILHNSKNLSDSFDVINSNSIIDLTSYAEKMVPDRRDNIVLNNSIRKIVQILNESNQEVLFSEMEKEEISEDSEAQLRLEFLSSKSRYVAHEIKNQLSICDLYSTIIQKQLEKLTVEKEVEASLKNAVNCIQKAIKMAGSSLIDLKALNNNELKSQDLKTLIQTSVELAKVYVNEKSIAIDLEIDETADVMVDENKFLGVLINLIKNAIESISKEGKIEIKTKKEKNDVSVVISNNGKPIEEEIQARIYEEGFTTKETGSGLGLNICRKSLEEQFAQLKLNKSDKISTEFEIILPMV